MSVRLRQKSIKDGKSFYLDIYQDGKRSYKFLGINIRTKGPNKDSTDQKKEKKKLAQEKAAQEQIKVISKGSSYVPAHLKKVKFADFAEGFLDQYRKADKRIVLGSVAKFKDFIQDPNYKLSDIDTDVMEGFKSYLLSCESLSGETPHNYFSRFKKILRSAKNKGIINEMPTDEIVFKNPNKNDNLKKEVLDIDELRLLAKTPCGNEEVKKAFLFCCYTGLGLAEAADLRWKNIKQGRLITSRKKTGSAINNQVNSAALKVIGERGHFESYVFDIQNISSTSVNKNLRYWSKRAEIDKKITFYCARHSFACLLLMNGANLKSVADAMGHASTRTTLKYLNHVERLKDEAISNLPDLEI